MISVTDLRAGAIFKENDEPLQVIFYEHIKMGRGTANIKVKVRNLTSGAVTEKSFINGAKVQEAALEKRELQFLYKDSDLAYFMDPSTFEQYSIKIKNLEGTEFIKEGEMTNIQFFDGVPISLLLPPKVVMKVIETPPGVKGNSASNIYKDALLQNGIKTKVPLFINAGDEIVIDTRDNTYTKRV